MAEVTLARVIADVNKLGGDPETTLICVNGATTEDYEYAYEVYRAGGIVLVDFSDDDDD